MRTYSFPPPAESALYEREPSSEYRIRFRDCDPFGHLHNTRYADYMLDAREEHLLETYGIDLVDWAKTRGLGWVVVGTKIRHFAAAGVSETVRVFTRLFSFDEKSLNVEARMYGKSGDLKALLWWSFRAIETRTGRPREHDAEFMRFCEAIAYPVPAPESFDDRARSIPRQL